MSNRTLFALIALAFLCMGALLLFNTASTLGVNMSKYINENDVRGSAIDYQGKLWTLNFDQQRALIQAINSATPQSGNSQDLVSSPGFTRIVIYRFDDLPDIEITPIGYLSSFNQSEQSLLFSSKDFAKGAALKENTKGTLKTLLQSLHD